MMAFAAYDKNSGDEALGITTALYWLLVHPAATAIDAAVLGRKPDPDAHASLKPRLLGVAPVIAPADRRSPTGLPTMAAVVTGQF